MKNMILIGGIVLIALLFLFAVQRGSEQDEAIESERVVQQSGATELPQQEKVPEPSGTSSSQNEEVERTELEAIAPYTGSGNATRIFNDEGFVHAVTADIGDPAEGKFYEGWLVNGTEFFSTGELVKKDSYYYVEYIDPIDQSAFSDVVITEETRANGFDNIPEAHVLEGTF
jgi:hypothetical protein